MYCIVGLGNPGNTYIRTRHNVGFLVVDEIAAYLHCSFRPGKGDFWYASCSLKNHDITLLKPVTFMNNSGDAIQDFMAQHSVSLQELLVVCDDIQLPLGSLRLRQNGSDGGHNGLASVIYSLATDQFARLRCGIGTEPGETEKLPIKEFVLSQFSDSEFVSVQSMVQRARDACESFILDGIDRTMNMFNVNPSSESSINK